MLISFSFFESLCPHNLGFPLYFNLYGQVIPRWHEHWTSNKVYDGDMIVLQGQEKVFLSKSKEEFGDVNKQYTTITFTPTQADRLVLAFRNWLRRHGNSQPEWFGTSGQQPLPSTILSKRQVGNIAFLSCLQRTQVNKQIHYRLQGFQLMHNFILVYWFLIFHLFCRCWTDLSSTHLNVHHVKELIQHSRHGRSC